MEKKIPSFIENAQKAAKKAVGEAGSALKSGGEAAVVRVGVLKHDMDLKRLKPVLLEQINTGDYQIPALLQIVDFHKNQANPVCDGAVGFGESFNRTNLFSLIRQYAESTNLTFVPNMSETLYYVHPFDPQCYISLDEYFKHLNEARVAELGRIAYDLGAKYAKISFKEEKTSIVSKKVKGKVGAKVKKDHAGAEIDHEHEERKYTEYANAEEWTFKGHNEPKMPDLVFFKSSPAITNLIEMRMSDPESVKTKNTWLACNASDGIKKKDSIQIDGVLKRLKLEGNTSMQSIAEQEAKRFLQYHIEF